MVVNDIVWVVFWILFFRRVGSVRGWDGERIRLLVDPDSFIEDTLLANVEQDGLDPLLGHRLAVHERGEVTRGIEVAVADQVAPIAGEDLIGEAQLGLVLRLRQARFFRVRRRIAPASAASTGGEQKGERAGGEGLTHGSLLGDVRLL